MAKKNNSNEIKITRIYDAPVKAVWDAWCDPKQAAQWWGPRGFTITTHSKDLRVGGTWNYTMHGPDGVDYPNITKYFEVEKYSRLVYDHGANANQPPLFRVTVNFTELKNKTKMEMSMAFESVEKATEIGKFIKKAGGEGTWDRLAEYLEKESSGKEKFVINRSFDAPIALMHKMWTDPKHFSKWLAPTGANMHFIRADIKAGGNTFYYMTYENGMKLYGKAHYLEVTPERMVYTQQFSDENEGITRHPMAPIWPETMLTTVKLFSEGPEKTRVTITWEVYGTATAEEIAFFVGAKGGMTQGWTGSFDKLEEYIEMTIENATIQ
jgi:uncharacterized protein YndB with AHSA1/START domain